VLTVSVVAADDGTYLIDNHCCFVWGEIKTVMCGGVFVVIVESSRQSPSLSEVFKNWWTRLRRGAAKRAHLFTLYSSISWSAKNSAPNQPTNQQLKMQCLAWWVVGVG
jgi:hypothetical protein